MEAKYTILRKPDGDCVVYDPTDPAKSNGNIVVYEGDELPADGFYRDCYDAAPKPKRSRKAPADDA